MPANNVTFFVTVPMQNRPINQFRFGKCEKLSFPICLHEKDVAVDNAADLPTGHLAYYDIDILGFRPVFAVKTSQNIEFLSRGQTSEKAFLRLGKRGFGFRD